MKTQQINQEALNSLTMNLEADLLAEKSNSSYNSIISEAAEFLKLFYTEQDLSLTNLEKRLAEIRCEV